MIQKSYQKHKRYSAKHSFKKHFGYLIVIETFYVCTNRGIRRNYQMGAIDTFSNYAWAELQSLTSTCNLLPHTYPLKSQMQFTW